MRKIKYILQRITALLFLKWDNVISEIIDKGMCFCNCDLLILSITETCLSSQFKSLIWLLRINWVASLYDIILHNQLECLGG